MGAEIVATAVELSLYSASPTYHNISAIANVYNKMFIQTGMHDNVLFLRICMSLSIVLPGCMHGHCQVCYGSIITHTHYNMDATCIIVILLWCLYFLHTYIRKVSVYFSLKSILFYSINHACQN